MYLVSSLFLCNQKPVLSINLFLDDVMTEKNIFLINLVAYAHNDLCFWSKY